ncbi:uncharacterized protein LOC106644990 [Copidosoma floridanum]|uniref:uncharacterized protein LOC106644990 n=1 Tax=Copidosoma floridanum TaxID=29053 RepID=UPI0006C9E47B|nr:uncharacterized protein LOC106644990 [Copidosoma floridanum]
MLENPKNPERLLKISKEDNDTHTGRRIQSKITQYIRTPKIEVVSQSTTPAKQSFNIKTKSDSLSKEENECDDEIVKSSQVTIQSDLRKMVNKSMLRRARNETPKSSPPKVQLHSPVSVIDKLSISEQEISDIYHDIVDEDPIEMTHDVDALITNDTLSSNVLEHSPIVSQTCKIEAPRIKDCSKSPQKNETKRKSPSKTSTTVTNSEKSKTNHTTPDLPQPQLTRLSDLKVKLEHKVPPQHFILSQSISRPLDEKKTILFKKYGLLKKGPFSLKEDEMIKKNWKRFCNIHEWNEKNVKPFLNMKPDRMFIIPLREQRLQFVQFIANGLPWRSLCSVYLRFRNLYNTDLFNKNDDKIIMNYISRTPKNERKNHISYLAKELKRKKKSVFNRYHSLLKKSNLKRDKKSTYSSIRRKKSQKKSELVHNKVSTNVEWTYPVVRKFLDEMLELTSCSHISELKNQVYDKNIWNQLGSKLDIDRVVLKKFWYLQLHMQLFCPKPIYLNDFKIELIEYLFKKQAEELENLEWEAICLDFDGTTPLFLSQMFDQLTQRVKKMFKDYSLTEIVNYLFRDYIPKLMERETDVVLPKLNSKLQRVFTISEKKVPSSLLKDPLDHDSFYLKELKNHMLLGCIWREMEKELEIDHTLLKSFWIRKLHLHVSTKTKSKIYINIQVNYFFPNSQFFFSLYKHKLTTRINWFKIVTYFDGYTKEFLQVAYNKILKDARQARKSNNPSVLLNYLYNKYIPFLINEKHDRILPRLKYTNNKLEFIDMD